MEILAPVGDRSMLDAALAGGCDAVYLALKHFGARAYAKNFTLEEVKDIIQRCHLIGVDVHVTMNTILYEEEVEAAAEAEEPEEAPAEEEAEETPVEEAPAEEEAEETPVEEAPAEEAPEEE